jgi:hypothetical protein
MNLFKNEYYRWIESRGVGSRDIVASSPDSYISYLDTVSELLGKDISPVLLSSEQDVEKIARAIEGMRAPKTIRNFKSAMRQYAAMVRTETSKSKSTRVGYLLPQWPRSNQSNVSINNSSFVLS